MRKQILKPRKTGEERKENYKVSIQKKIKKYNKNGGKGDLYLSGTPIEKLPDNLKVGGSLYLRNTPIKELPDNLQVGGDLSLKKTPLSKKYSEEKIRNMIEEKGGYVKRNIFYEKTNTKTKKNR